MSARTVTISVETLLGKRSPLLLKLHIGLKARMDSKSTKEVIVRSLATTLKVPVEQVRTVELRARPHPFGKVVDLQDLEDETVFSFSTRPGAAIVADLLPLVEFLDWEARLAALEHDSKNIKAQHKQIKAEYKQIKAELSILRECSEEYPKVLRRSLVETVHQFLEASAGPRRRFVGASGETSLELWVDYLDRILVEKGLQWFVDLRFPITCFGLLSMGADTPFILGADAAHNLRTLNPGVFRSTYLADLTADEQRQWTELYNFVERIT